MSRKPVSYPVTAGGTAVTAAPPGGGGRRIAATPKRRRVSQNEKYQESLYLTALTLATQDNLDLTLENTHLRRELRLLRRRLRTALHDLQHSAGNHQAAQRT
jgi:hypothetical protein